MWWNCDFLPMYVCCMEAETNSFPKNKQQNKNKNKKKTKKKRKNDKIKLKRNTEYKIAESKGKLRQHFKKWTLEASWFFCWSFVYAVSERVVVYVSYYSEVLSEYAKKSGGLEKK